MKNTIVRLTLSNDEDYYSAAINGLEVEVCAVTVREYFEVTKEDRMIKIVISENDCADSYEISTRSWSSFAIITTKSGDVHREYLLSGTIEFLQDILDKYTEDTFIRVFA